MESGKPSINPDFGKDLSKRKNLPTIAELAQGIIAGNRAILSRSLTLAESKLDTHRQLAEELIQQLLPETGNSLRIGITGVPGVGKSTFIEAFGSYLIEEHQKKVAVLAIDPSSLRTKGSILGDKTRMEKLSANEKAFIRPSPSSGSLGGVSQHTREAIFLCEAAGFDVIIIETVGVGQSETAVKSMVDFFLLLMLAGAGDELQGIKRGIMEMADLLLINKADGDNQKEAKRAKAEYSRALHLFPPNPNEWTPRVNTCSAAENRGMEEVWNTILEFELQQKSKGHFQNNRKQQAINWFREAIGELLLHRFYQDVKQKERILSLELQIKEGEIEAFTAAKKLIDSLWNTN